jgi:fumarylacetoacetase
MLAHHTVGGCPMRTGDLIATGTLSGPTREELGCLLEITRNGKESIEMNAKDTSDEKVVRTFLLDRDTVEFDAKVEHQDGYSVGFGTCVGTVLPSKL